MKTIYVVTTGQYSDYHIVAVFDNKEMAQALADNCEYGGSVEEWPLNPEYIDYKSQGFSAFSIGMLKDGTVLRASEDSTYPLYERKEALFPDPAASIILIPLRFTGLYEDVSPTDETLCLRGHIIAQSKEQAVKIVNEKRIQLLAEDQWKNRGLIGGVASAA